MRGIPSAFLVFFVALVILIELISYFGIWQLIKGSSKRTIIAISSLYALISLFTSGLLIYAFSNPEVIRQARSYTFFYFVISVTFLNLFPKFVFTLITLFSFLPRWVAGKRYQLILLTGSFVICTGLFTIILYGIYWGRYTINVEKQDLYFNNWPEQLNGFKIVQLSDIHLGSFGNNPEVMAKTVQIVKGLDPDLLLFTGDLVNNFGDEIKGFEPYLNQLSGRYGKYAIQGNHDYGDYSNWPDSASKLRNLHQIESGLTDAGFKLLLNSWDKISVKDTAFALIGVENWGHRPFPQYADLDAAMKGIPANSFEILMTHDPAHWSAKVVPDTDIPLTLSGHTHGGQFGIKIAGIEFSPIYFIEKNWGGLYQSQGQTLYVNRGLGTIGYKGRIEMRPEITLLTLYRTKSH
ncbi:MAG TPA: metallophosphoesterase [Prolixibacteraceae bacterium]|jgi:predicted MPP superfamily phosphohydrolase|nr:metallophosphoesterase [Prolixibacteraceae bacterium]